MILPWRALACQMTAGWRVVSHNNARPFWMDAAIKIIKSIQVRAHPRFGLDFEDS